MVFKFTIDNVVNKYIPANRLDRLPKLLARFLGAHTPSPHHDYLIWIEIFIGSFAGIALIEGVFKNPTVFTHHAAPMIIASYGASAILCFNANQAPLAQPRNVVMGQFVASLIGVCIQKLFSLSEAGRNNYWASGALSVAVSSVAMSILNCVHPPAGASALLPSADESIRDMSWWYLPAQLVSSCLILSVALITGNILRKYPVYWWTPAPVGKPKPDPEQIIEKVLTPKPSRVDSDVISNREGVTFVDGLDSIQINLQEILVPAEIDLDELSIEWLDTFQIKLKEAAARNENSD